MVEADRLAPRHRPARMGEPEGQPGVHVRRPSPRPRRSRRPPRSRAGSRSGRARARARPPPTRSRTRAVSKHSSTAVAANSWVVGSRVSSTSCASGRRWKPTAPGSPRAARLPEAHRTPTGAPPGGESSGRTRASRTSSLGPPSRSSYPAFRPRSRSPSASGPVAEDGQEHAVGAAGSRRLGIVRPVRRRPRRTRNSRGRSSARAGRRPPSAPGSGSAASAARRRTAPRTTSPPRSPRRSPPGPSARTAPSGSRRRGGRCGRSARGWPPAPGAAAAPRR